ncbi:MAG TPA: DedA family protein [Deltaproteobacteria bacterium]|jgi:membrane protein DedA with SNARE-associated domain|nr:DedA family protein [Deltaproteobacteria bacterium]HQI01029.1 DedA family protein [Deltaproteobacteria bacterium]HQJ08505.1 DedA family protein [Deltaproteobacteria bacterium]
MEEIVLWLVKIIGDMGYFGIFILMAMESSLFPIPSELVVPPAGYLASQNQMNIWIVIFLSTLGSLVGALFNYALAYYLGRPWILKYGKYFLIPPEKFARVESFFLKHGEISTFTGRLIIVIRHLISLPAGLSKMDLVRFSAFTVIGSLIWVSILAYIGFIVGNNMALVEAYYKQAVVILVVAMVIVLGIYVFWHKSRAKPGNI